MSDSDVSLFLAVKRHCDWKDAFAGFLTERREKPSYQLKIAFHPAPLPSGDTLQCQVMIDLFTQADHANRNYWIGRYRLWDYAIPFLLLRWSSTRRQSYC
jgi:hypothetical protein